MITNLVATESGHWGQADSYDANASDPDNPADVLSWSLGVDTCGFAPSVVATTGVVSWTCVGVETCNVPVTVTDDGAGTLTDTATVNVTVNDINDAPVFDSDPWAFNVDEKS